MITDGEKWHYLALKSGPIFYGGRWCNRPIKRLSKLLRGKPSNHHGDFYCLNCFNSYNTENRPKEHEEICNKQDNSSIRMFRWVDRILKYTHGGKPLKAPFAFAIYLDLECLLKKENHVKTILKNGTQRKKNVFWAEPSGWAIFTKCSFNAAENKLDFYRGRDCIEKLSKKLKEDAMKIINYEEKRNDTTN